MAVGGGPGLLGAQRMRATPDSFVPAHHDRSAADRQVAYPHRAAILRPRHRAAIGARYDPCDRLNQQLQLTAGIRGGQHTKPNPNNAAPTEPVTSASNLGLLDNPCDLGRDHGSCEPQAHHQLISEPEACRPVSPLPGSWRRAAFPPPFGRDHALPPRPYRSYEEAKISSCHLQSAKTNLLSEAYKSVPRTAQGCH